MFTISLLGFDDRSADTLGHAARATMNIVDPINKDDTQVVIVDIDGPDGDALWDDFKKQWPQMPAVIVSSTDPNYDNTSFTEKPFTVEALIDNITEAIILFPAGQEASTESSDNNLGALVDQEQSEMSDSQTAENELVSTETTEASSDEISQQEPEVIDISADITISDTKDDVKNQRPLSEIANVLTSRSTNASSRTSRTLDLTDPEDSFFNPETYMISLVIKGASESLNNGKIGKLACLLDRTIYIDAQKKIVSSNLKDIHMRQISIAPLGEGDSGLDTQLEMIDSQSIEELSGAGSTTYPLDTFIWELALLTSKGRVPVGTPLDKPTYLTQWPNFTRLMHIPNDMKIAAYWLRLPSSLNDLSENLDVPINDVRLLYSAAFLTGLAGIASRDADYMLRPGKPEEHENRNLFGSLMDKFGK